MEVEKVDGVFSGKNPTFDVAGMMAIQEQLEEPEFCVNWLTTYERTGGKFIIPGPCDWRDMPHKVLKKVTETCMAFHVAAVMKQMEVLH